MIAKYKADCRYCSKPIQVGHDIYDTENRSSYHRKCDQAQPPSAETLAIAERLGFCPNDPGSIRGMVEQWQSMRGMREADRSPAAEREVGSPAQRRPNINLFGEEVA